jgi:hypothetical protein
MLDNTVVGRYERDAHFRTIVDTLEALIHEASYTPTEIREAAMLAQIRYESRRMPRLFIIPLRVEEP